MALWKSILKPDQSVVVSLGVAAGVFAVYQMAMPSLVEVHAAPAHNGSVANSQKKAMWTSALLVTGSYLLTRDPNVFVAGGAAFVGIEWLYRHANQVDPNTGKIVKKGGGMGHQSSSTAMTSDDTYDYSGSYAG